MVSRRLGGIFVLKKKSLHRDMADVNVYTARRLKDMAMSLSGLAQAFADNRLIVNNGDTQGHLLLLFSNLQAATHAGQQNCKYGSLPRHIMYKKI